MPAKPYRGASVRGRAQLGRPPRSPGSAATADLELELLTLGAHAHSEGYSSCRVCMYVCVTTHNCRLTQWNHKTKIPTSS